MARIRTVLKDTNSTPSDWTIVVALANPNTVTQLLRTATDLAAYHGGDVLAVSVIHKNLTSPFLLFSADTIKEKYAGDEPDILDSAVATNLNSSVPIRRHLLVSNNVSNAILEAIDSAAADAALFGWHTKPKPADIVIGTTVDPVIRKTPCTVYVERVGTTADAVESILVPTVGGPHAEPAAELANAVAVANSAEVTVMTFSEGAEHERTASAEASVEWTASLIPDVPVRTVIQETTDVAGGIVKQAAAHDLVILGATRERSFRQRTIGSVAQVVSQRARPPVVVAKKRRERSRFWDVLSR